MARYTGPKCKNCRRFGMKLCSKPTNKCAWERRKNPPGDRSLRRRRITEYGLQLREKQKARAIYGILERQFRNYFDKARERPGITGENLLQLLERRLDNVVYRMAFAQSRDQGRQFVSHGHFMVNDRKMDIPSYLVEPGDTIKWKSANGVVPEFAKTAMESAATITNPEWIKVERDKGQVEIIAEPTLDAISHDIDVRLIVEFYSK